MADIFVSYSRTDHVKVARLVSALEAYQFTIFWDQYLRAGDNWRSVIEGALQDAKCVLVIWTLESISSRWVLDESTVAEKRGVLIPVLLDPVDQPLGFRGVQALDLQPWLDGRDPSAIHMLRLAIEQKIIKTKSHESGPSAEDDFQSNSSSSDIASQRLFPLRTLRFKQGVRLVFVALAACLLSNPSSQSISACTSSPKSNIKQALHERNISSDNISILAATTLSLSPIDDTVNINTSTICSQQDFLCSHDLTHPTQATYNLQDASPPLRKGDYFLSILYRSDVYIQGVVISIGSNSYKISFTQTSTAHENKLSTRTLQVYIPDNAAIMSVSRGGSLPELCKYVFTPI